MIRIPLTQRKHAIVDDDMAHLAKWKWHANKGANTFYAVRFTNRWDGGYVKKQAQTALHWCVIGFPLNGLVTDHINGNGLDNRRSNLRHVTHTENLRAYRTKYIHKRHRNRERRFNIERRYIGVYRHPTQIGERWIAIICINGKSKYLGVYGSQQDANDARIKALAMLKNDAITHIKQKT